MNTPLLQDRYRLLTVLSHGRSATTWKAVDASTGEACVVKELSVGDVVRRGSSELSYDGDFPRIARRARRGSSARSTRTWTMCRRFGPPVRWPGEPGACRGG